MNYIIKKALNQEAYLADLVNSIVDSVSHDLECCQPLNGVSVQSTAFPCATVSFLALDKTILSPDYYIPKAQAAVVRKRLQKAKTVSELINMISAMVETQQVSTSSGMRRLNGNTVQALKKYL